MTCPNGAYTISVFNNFSTPFRW